MNLLHWLGIDFKTFANEKTFVYAMLLLSLGAIVYLIDTNSSEIESATNKIRLTEQQSCDVRLKGYQNELKYIRTENKELKKIIIDQQEMLFKTHFTNKLP